MGVGFILGETSMKLDKLFEISSLRDAYCLARKLRQLCDLNQLGRSGNCEKT